MEDSYRGALMRLRAAGWKVQENDGAVAFPPDVLARYAWLPRDVRTFLEAVESASSADDKTWLLTSRELSSSTDSAFVWNQWERMSLEAAAGDRALEGKIAAFWNDHFPFMMSVRDGYAYLALEKGSLRVVQGDEPEFEETRAVASSVLEAVEMATRAQPTKSRWA